VIALLGVTALASREPLNRFGSVGAAPAAGSAPQATATPWALTLIGAGATVALIGLLAYRQGFLLRRREPELAARPPFRTPWFLRIGLPLALVLLGAALVKAAIDGSHQRRLPRAQGGGSVVFGRGGVTRLTRGTGPSSFALPSWVTSVVLVLVIAGGAALAIQAISRRRGRSGTPPVELAPAIRGAVALSIEDLRADPDSRRAVIAAYARMEAALGAAGLPRGTFEAPREYLTRVLGSLEVSGRPIRTLTSLFERARFSLHRIDPPLRDEAISALDQIRTELDLA
jgi:Domain of unknown function (DUF4129)